MKCDCETCQRRNTEIAEAAAYANNASHMQLSWLDERDFYEIMQEYRHAPDLEGGLPNQAAKAFEKVKQFIRRKVR